MMLLQILFQAALDWIRDLLAELLSRCIGAFVTERRKRARAKSGKGRREGISKEHSVPETDAADYIGAISCAPRTFTRLSCIRMAGIFIGKGRPQFERKHGTSSHTESYSKAPQEHGLEPA